MAVRSSRAAVKAPVSVQAPGRSRAATAKAAAPEADKKDSSRERLLDAAEWLFAEIGYAGVAVREIAGRADVNLGSIPYYFGTKENMLKEVLLRRVLPMQKERREQLEAVMKGSSKPRVEDILRAIFEPAFRTSREHAVYRKLAGRLATDPTPEVRKVMDELYNPKTLVFPKALRAACPQLDSEEFNWRLMCVYGAMFYVQADTGRMQTVAPGFDTTNPDSALKFVLPFLAAGLRAGPASRSKKPAK
jgi:AcrR family transcriptional regulator